MTTTRPSPRTHSICIHSMLRNESMMTLLLVLLATPAARAFAPPSGQYGTLSPCTPSSCSRLVAARPVQRMVHRRTQRAPLCLRKSSNNKINNEDDTTKAAIDVNNDTASSALRSTTSPLSEVEAARQRQVRWDELLEATAPLSCEDGDEECHLLQLEELWENQHDKITAKDYCIMGSFVTAMTAAFVWLVSVSGPGGWKYYLAGGLCAAASHVIPVPIDVVKTRKQVDPELASQSFPQAFSYILRTEGVGGLLSGLGPTAVGYLMEGAIKYGIYEVLKPVVLQLLARLAVWSKYLAFLNSTVTAYSISAAISGIAASIMLLPMEALRIRMVANPEKRSRGWLVTGYKMLKNEGATSMTKAVAPMLSKQVPYTVTKNVSFDFITKMSYAALVSRGNIIGPMSKMVVPFVAAAFTSVLSCITSQPGDMVLSLMNAHKNDRRRTRDIVHDIFMSERGVKGFFVGLKTRFLHVGIIVTLQLLIYDFVKRLCGIAATGMAH